jgi:ABC-type transporter Mla subunit MlaD
MSATLAVVAAGCGGGASAEEKWADSVCAPVGTWKSQIQKSTDEIREKVRSPGAGTLAAVQGDVQEAIDATQKLGSDLKALDAPNTDSGAQAKQRLDSLADQLQTTAAQANQTVQGVPDSATLSQTIQQLAPLAAALQSLASSASSTLDSIQASSTKLKDGFEKADSCEQFG